MKAMEIMLGILLVGFGFVVGMSYGQETVEPKIIKEVTIKVPDAYYEDTYPEPMTVNEALKFIRNARYSHQLLIDLGEPLQLAKADGTQPTFVEVGDLELQKKVVKQYDQLENLVIRLSEGR